MTFLMRINIKSKERSLYGRSNLFLRQFYFCSTAVKNRLFTYYCSVVYMCASWTNYRKCVTRHFIISYNNAFRIIHNLKVRCSASIMFVRARINSGKMQIRMKMYSLLSRLYSSENAIIISIVRSGMFEDSTLYQQWLEAMYLHCYTP